MFALLSYFTYLNLKLVCLVLKPSGTLSSDCQSNALGSILVLLKFEIFSDLLSPHRPWNGPLSCWSSVDSVPRSSLDRRTVAKGGLSAYHLVQYACVFDNRISSYTVLLS